MPLKRGKKNIGANIRELKEANKGKIKPRSQKQIVAIALSEAYDHKKKSKKGKRRKS